MTAVALQSLPLGFRFHPTDEELINHYLKPKITGRSTSEVEVVAEIDVCKCEPWHLPDKSIIRSDDPEWFFFAPKDRKYPNGHRANRATEKGYWKATGTDRIVRSKPSSEKSIIIGMKKTLVFHRGRAPKGVRTNWIMHEYRTTEPEFESGDQGGYILYRLFKKPEEKSSSSSTDAMETNGVCPTPTKACPSDFHEAGAMDETEIMTTHRSPMSDMQGKPKSSSDSVQIQLVGTNGWLASEDYSASLLVKKEKKCSIMVSTDEVATAKEKDIHKREADPLQDVLVHDPDREQIGSDIYPNVSWPLLPFADDYLIGNAHKKLRTGSHPVNNAGGDALDPLLISALSSGDTCSGASVFPKDPFDGSFPSWDSASCKGSVCSSDLDTESGLLPDAGLEAFDCFGGSLLPSDSLEMDNSVLFPEMKTQLSTLYENASLLPYDVNGPDVYSVDSGAESLQELFSSFEELNSHTTMSDNNNVFEGSGIKLRSRQLRQEQSNPEISQGNATRRIHLQHSIGQPPLGTNHFESTGGDDNESKEPIDNVERELLNFMAKSTSEINTMRNRGDAVETGIRFRPQQLPHFPNESFTQPDEKFTSWAEEHQFYSELSIRNSSDGKPETQAAGEHVGDNISEVGDSPACHILDKLEGLSLRDSDDTPSSSNNYQMQRSVLRVRKKAAKENTLKDWPCSKAFGCNSVVDYMILLSCLFLWLLCVGLWRCIDSGSV